MTETTISKAFSDLTDPRKSAKHPFINILTIAICAIISGCDNFNAMEEYGKSKMLNRLNPHEFHEAFVRWITELSKQKEGVIALDGKVMRRTLDKASGMSATHLVSAWSVENNFCLGQIKVSEKSNEITAIPILLNLLDINGATITTDAMGCQFKIANQIIEKEADYLLALKGNQGEFFDDVKLYLDNQVKNKFKNTAHSDNYCSINGDHGRIETRDVWLTTDVDWLKERHPRWSSLKGMIVVCSTRELNGKISYEQRYYVSSHIDKDAEFFCHAIRSHWHVENKLHWQLDVSFNEDQNRSRSGFAAQNVALINKIALNLLKNENTAKVGIKSKRLKAGWDNAYLMKVLTVGLVTD